MFKLGKLSKALQGQPTCIIIQGVGDGYWNWTPNIDFLVFLQCLHLLWFWSKLLGMKF
jgi:hypothetical protein